MRGSLCWVLLAFLTLAIRSSLCGADEPTAASVTTVHGTVPDLVGNWLVIGDVVQPQGGQGMSVASLWEVTAADGTPNLVVRWVKLPQAVQDGLDAANKAQRPWDPTAADLGAIRDGWSTLPPGEAAPVRTEVTITGKDAFTDVMKGDEKFKDAQFIIQMIVNFAPAPGRPIRDVYLYGAMEPLPNGWRGNYGSASVAGAPVPVPITLQGTFRAYRLEQTRRGF